MCWLLLVACGSDAPAPADLSEKLAPSYVGTDACRNCHTEQYADWQRSHHRMAMQPATAETVVGDFSGSSFEYAGVTYEFSMRDDAYVVLADDENGDLREFPISHTFGIDPLQQYLIPFPDGRLQALSVAWDTRPAAGGGQRWFHLYPDESITYNDELHWTGRNQNWNYMCADCHSTDLRKDYDQSGKTYSTSWAEVTVGCEACHGPGSVHVANADSDDYADSGFSTALDKQAVQVDTCAKCHARRGILAEGFEPGDAFLDHYRPALLDGGLYHADGQILDEVYVYGSFLQSKMFQRGVRCTDCHNPHSADLEIGGNGTCTACHQGAPPARFPALKAAVYDHPDHHFHEPGSEGAKCVSCHMPAKLYMVVDARRDHSFRIPRPDLSAATGSPNTCNGCHTDQDAGWATAEISKRYPGARLAHYGQAIAAGRNRSPDAPGRLADLAADATAPAIVRGTALSLLDGRMDSVSINALGAGLRDEEPLVRLGALAGAGNLNIEQVWPLARNLLDDPLLAVRTEAAIMLAPMLQLDLRQTDQERLLAALDDYIETQRVNTDRPEALTNLAGAYAQAGRDAEAEQAYMQALDLDRNWLPALINLADYYRGSNRQAEAAELLSRAKGLAPENGAVRLAYGLLLVREGRRDEALVELEAATTLAPQVARYRYVYGVALNSMGRGGAAVRVLEAGLAEFPDDSDLLYALATIERDRGNAAEALGYVDRLLELQPGNPRLLQLRRELQSAVAN